MKLLRNLALVAGLLLGSVVAGQAQQIDCRSKAIYDASTLGSTQLVAGTARTRIFICGYTIVGGGAATVGLVTGTGTNCATAETKLTPAYSLVAQTVVTESSSIHRGLEATPGLDVCIKSSAAVAVQAIIYYSQR